MCTEEHPVQNTKHNVEINAEDVIGIIHHVDKVNIVYNTEDILKGIENPRIVATYKAGIINYL